MMCLGPQSEDDLGGEEADEDGLSFARIEARYDKVEPVAQCLYFTFIIGFCWTISVATENDYVRNDRLSSSLADCILENFLNLNIGADVHAVMISFGWSKRVQMLLGCAGRLRQIDFQGITTTDSLCDNASRLHGYDKSNSAEECWNAS